jgi:structural hemagglutinin/hemolysin toxin protein RtxA
MYHVAFYVPETHLEIVKNSMFKAGAGHMGNYDCCSFESRGVGQFRPLIGSDPFIGKMGEIERVMEVKVEMICQKDVLKNVLLALRATHPYETPAYYVIEVVSF